MRTGRPPTF